MLKNTYAIGEGLPAADLNTIVNLILQNSHNIEELYMENYIASKATPYQGLFFDAFSDTTKAESTANAGTNVAGTAGQTKFTVNSDAELANFSAGDLIIIGDGSNQEINTVTGKASNVVESNLASFAFSTTKPANWSDSGLVNSNTQRRIQSAWNSPVGGDSSIGTLSKAASGLTIGATYTLTLNCAWTAAASFGNDFTIEIKIGGVQAAAYTTPYGGGSYNFSTTFVPTTSNPTIQVNVYDNYSSNNNANWIWTFSFSNFQLTLGNSVFVQNALANTYSGGTAKKTSTAIDTTNKKITMTAGWKKDLYQSKETTFSQDMAGINAWLMRTNAEQYTPTGAAAQGATTVGTRVTSGTFAAGDVIELYNATTKYRERKTISGVSVGSDGAAAAFDATATLAATTGTSGTFAHTNSATNPFLVVAVYYTGGVAPAVTYAGAAMTKFADVAAGNDGVNTISLFKKTSPATGANNVVITFGASCTFTASSVSFTNASDADNVSAAGGGTLPVSTSTATTNGDMVFGVLGTNNNMNQAGFTFDAGSTSRFQDYFTAGKVCFAGATKPATTTTTAMTLGAGQGSAAGTIVCRIKQLNPTSTLTFTPAVSAAAGFTTADKIVKVAAIPQVSLVDSAASHSYQNMTYVRSAEVTVDGATYVEDQYSYTPGTPENKFRVRVIMSRGDTSQTPSAKRLAVTLNI